MLKATSYWSLEGGWENKLPPNDALKSAKEYGFDAVELALGDGDFLNMKTEKQEIQEILDYSEKINTRVSSLASAELWKYNMASNNIDERNKAKEIIKKMIEVASWLKVDKILVIPGIVENIAYPEKEIISYDKVYERTYEVLDDLKKDAEIEKIKICLENVWSKFLLSPLELRDLIDSFNSEYIGSYFDVGNVILYGYPEQWIRILGKRIMGIHIKDFKREIGTLDGFCNLLEGDVNFKEVMKALREIGYDDSLVSEIMPAEKSVIKKTSSAFNKILSY
jgi:L-ribulose-5-phosphate 3-epimerase